MNIIIVAAILSLVDIFYQGNSFFQCIVAISCSFVVFNLGQLSFKLKKKQVILLLLANSILLLCTFSHRVLLLNMFMLAYLVWNAITPRLLRYKNALPLSFAATLVSVYAASFLPFSVPLFLFVFYPVYLFGAMVKDHSILPTRKFRSFGIFNLLFSASLLAVFMYHARSYSVLGSIAFLNFEKLGTVTAIYLPFIALFFVWFASSLNVLIFTHVHKNNEKRPSFDFSPFVTPFYTCLSFFAFVICSAFICEWSIRLDFWKTIQDMLDPGMMFNILFLCALYLFLISLLGKGISNIIMILVTLFLSIANFIKFTYLDEPFYPWDVYLFRNLVGISKEYIGLPVLLVASVVFLVAIGLLYRFRVTVAQYLKPNLTVALLPFALLPFILNANILLHNSVSAQIGIQKTWYIGKNEILSNGMFAQNFYYLQDLDKYLNPKPEGYSKESMRLINKRYENTQPETIPTTTDTVTIQPDVIVIMSESFWDITQLKGISYSADIAHNIHVLQKGEIAPPIIGGGTANTEFESLSGLSMAFMNPGVIAYNAYLRSATPSLASVFKANGYTTTAIHPNEGWFYNRDKVYANFGFDTFLDIKSFDRATQKKGSQISDDVLVNTILETLDSSTGSSFIFAVSIENHDPYTDKYEKLDVSITAPALDDSQKEIITGYAQGMYDADQSLGKLVASLSKRAKPTLVYFFGDHAPRLGSVDDFYKIYNTLGTKKGDAKKKALGEIAYYTTPLASWSNYTRMRDFPSVISPSHIAYEVLKQSAVNYPSYWNILPQLEAAFPIIHPLNLNTIDATNELMRDYQLIQYDLLFGEKYLLDAEQ